MPKVSIILPVYGVAECIEQCAHSVFGQTMEDLEIVFVDDCTPDNSIEIMLEVLEQYPSRKSQVKVLRNTVNSGLAKTRWNGVEKATGEYFLFVDSDDFIEVTMAEDLYAKAQECDADVVLCDFCQYGRSGSFVVNTAPNGVVGNGENLKDEMINRDAYPNVWFRLFRRSLLENEGLVWPTQGLAEDVVTSSVLMFFAQKVAYLPKVLYHYRFNPKSITRMRDEQSLVKLYLQYVENAAILFDFLERQGVSQKYEKGITSCKMGVRNQLAEITDKPKYRKLWKNTFPELNKVMFWGSKEHPSSYRNKIWYLAMVSGLYPKFRRILLSKYLRPSNEWRKAILTKLE